MNFRLRHRRASVVTFMVVAALLALCTTAPAERDVPEGFIWDDGNALIHRASGAVFAARYTDFVRKDGDIVRYDEKARDVSVGYVCERTLGITNIYVYPAQGQADGDVLLREYEQCKRDVFEEKNVIKLLNEQSGDSEFDIGKLPMYFAAFLIDEGVQWYSLLTLVGKGDWFVLYRVSFPASAENDEIFGIMTRLPWDFAYLAIR